jgi:hypothetical protein
MNNATQTCRIDTGDFVGSALRGPEWTPYAQAIADHYPIQVPWYLTKRQAQTRAVIAIQQLPVVQVTRPQLYDTLILGVSVTIEGTGTNDNGNFIYLQITDLETGIPWVAPNTIGYAPVLAFGGLSADPTTGAFQVMPVMKLPEAYFMPKGTRLRLEWFLLPPPLVSPVNTTATITFIGVQLINHAQGFKAPRTVVMPNGHEIEVGSRLPWFGCVPFGRRSTVPGSARNNPTITLPDGEQVIQFLPPVDCPVEIHDAYANFLNPDTTPLSPPDKVYFKVKLQDMMSTGDWTPEPSPAPAIFGNESQVFPALPFAKPHLLKPEHRTAMAMLNVVSPPFSVDLSVGTVTLRGVRLCEY